MQIKISDLRKYIESILLSSGFLAGEAKAIADVLIYAETAGKKTQGILKLLGNEPLQMQKYRKKLRVEKETTLSVFINGGRNPAMLVGKVAMQRAIAKCAAHGIGIAGANNTYASTGALGYYVNEIARKGFIGVVLSGTPKGVALYGSRDKRVGINPIAFGFPTEQEPVIIDMATAAMTWYGLVQAKMTGTPLEADVALDEEGRPATIAERAMKGALLTFGNNRKMSGISMAIEMLTGPLMGAMAPQKDGTLYNGNFFLVIDPALFIGRKQFKRHASELLKRLKTSRPARGFTKFLLPGEKAQQKRKKAEESGFVSIEQEVYEAFLKLL